VLSIHSLFVETFALTWLSDLASGTDTRGAGVEENDEQSTLGSMCQKNVDNDEVCIRVVRVKVNLQAQIRQTSWTKKEGQAKEKEIPFI
jgi:hypothetical protein